jgi:hypothetical protein
VALSPAGTVPADADGVLPASAPVDTAVVGLTGAGSA